MEGEELYQSLSLIQEMFSLDKDGDKNFLYINDLKTLLDFIIRRIEDTSDEVERKLLMQIL